MGGFISLAVLSLLAPPILPFPELPQGALRVRPTELTSAVEDALKQLELPCPPRGHLNEPIRQGPCYGFLDSDMYEDCPDAMDLLANTREPIDDRLLELARNDKRLAARYRAAWVLAHRRNTAVVPILEKMAGSAAPEERYLGWTLYWRSLQAKDLPVPTDFDLAIRAYRNEKQVDLHLAVTCFLGTARARPAVPMLINAVRANPRCASEIQLLGTIGDPRAVPVIIQAAKELGGPPGFEVLYALGRLGTAEAAEFLIEHLERPEATQALFETRSPKALPALQQHLEKLKANRSKDDSDLEDTRLAVLRLKYPDSRERLMQLAEDQRESRRLRKEALRALREYDASPFAARVLAIYASNRDCELRMSCVPLLRDEKLPGITEAMVEHAIGDGAPLWYEGHDLREALNQRLGTSFRNLMDLQRYLRKNWAGPEKQTKMP
jgi:HEAT repeat protein